MIQYPCGCPPKVLVYEGTFGYSAVQCPAYKKYAMFDYEHMTARPMAPIKGLTHTLQLHNGIYHWDIGVVGRPPPGRGRKEITAFLTVICFLSRLFLFSGGWQTPLFCPYSDGIKFSDYLVNFGVPVTLYSVDTATMWVLPRVYEIATFCKKLGI